MFLDKQTNKLQDWLRNPSVLPPGVCSEDVCLLNPRLRWLLPSYNTFFSKWQLYGDRIHVLYNSPILSLELNGPYYVHSSATSTTIHLRIFVLSPQSPLAVTAPLLLLLEVPSHFRPWVTANLVCSIATVLPTRDTWYKWMLRYV